MVTNNETYFFRETHQFDLLVNHVIPERRAALRAARSGSCRPGCSSGEEPYSLAIALHNAGLPLAGVTWEIDACDLNPERIARAQEALYGESSLRACDADARRRYFTAEAGRISAQGEVPAAACAASTPTCWRPTGLLGWAVYDAILCRNLLIYFSDEAFGRPDRAVRPLPGARGLPVPGPQRVAARPEDAVRARADRRRRGLPQARGGRMTRVFLVDDSAFVRRALTRVLAIEPGFTRRRARPPTAPRRWPGFPRPIPTS